MEQNNNRPQIVGIPGAIIIAATIIAIALVYIFHPVTKVATVASNQNPQLPQVNITPVTAADHILGNPNAPIKIVEYSDPSCPYCKMFNPTMEQIMSTYGPGGKVAWVYRSFPLDKPDANGNMLHPNAGHEAQGLECAAFLGGNTTFWSYEKSWYDNFPLQGATDRSVASDTVQLVSLAKAVGLDTVAFNDCLSSGQFKNKIDAQYTDGINAGVSGTPHNIIITPTGDKIPLVGAVSYATIKTTIDTLLTEVK
jgi:protein-disulfide isomerase